MHVLEGTDKVQEVASQMLGHNLITKQTGQAGRPCNMVFVCEKLSVAKEYYFAITMDRASAVRHHVFTVLRRALRWHLSELLVALCRALSSSPALREE